MGTLIRLALRRTLRQIRHLSPVRPGRGQDLVARVHRQVERDFGLLAPPIALHTASPGALAGSWAMLRESLVARGEVDRAVKEVVAAGVSEGNRCPYCVDVHSATLGGLLGGDVAESGLDGLADPALLALGEWARTGGAEGSTAPFAAGQAAELVGVAVTFHYLNRMVNVFLGDSPLPPSVPEGARGRARRVLGRVMRVDAARSHAPGDALDLLPPAEAPAELAWARGNDVVHEAFARAYAAIDAAGERSVPERVRALVTAELDAWDGRPVGPSRAWALERVAGLPAEERPAGLLALLTAMAAYQVDDEAVTACRRVLPGDRELVELTSWAALAAARRLGVGRARLDLGPAAGQPPFARTTPATGESGR